MVHLGFQNFAACLYECRFHFDSIRLTRPEQQLDRPYKFSTVEVAPIFDRRFHRCTFANLVTSESKSRRITPRSSYRRYSPGGDSSKRILVVGCSEQKKIVQPL